MPVSLNKSVFYLQDKYKRGIGRGGERESEERKNEERKENGDRKEEEGGGLRER